MNDVLCCSKGSFKDLSTLKRVLELLCKATEMEINYGKYRMLTSPISYQDIHQIQNLFPFQIMSLELGLKYLGFYLNPDKYIHVDWFWMIKKVEAQVLLWVNRLFSRGGPLVLLQSVLESISIFCTSIATLPKGILTQNRKVIFHYLSLGSL